LEAIKKMKSQIDLGLPLSEVVQTNSKDKPFTLCGLLKLWVRDLPEPLLTFNLFDDFCQVAKMEDYQKRTDCLKNLLVKLPFLNRKVLTRLIHHFHFVTEFEKDNKMNAESISVVFGMNILKPKKDDPTLLASTARYVNKITELLVSNPEFYLPKEILLESDEAFDSPRKLTKDNSSDRIDKSLQLELLLLTPSFKDDYGLMKSPSEKDLRSQTMGKLQTYDTPLPPISTPPPLKEGVDMLTETSNKIWKVILDKKTERHYYFNPLTGTVTWENPDNFTSSELDKELDLLGKINNFSNFKGRKSTQIKKESSL